MRKLAALRPLLGLLMALLIVTTSSYADTTHVRGVRMWEAPDNTRIVFDISSPAEYTLFTLENPNRVVVDLNDARLVDRLSLDKAMGQAKKRSLVNGLRSGSDKGSKLRLVLDLSERVKPKSFLLKPNQEYGHRLVIDLHKADTKTEIIQKTLARHGPRELIIAIDAGHGGEDPGAGGRKGTKEKDVVLAIAKRLADLVEKEPGMRPVMIRDGDYFVSLRKRIEKARAQQADLFLSIHADSYKNKNVRGASVYVLSQDGATDEAARLLAKKENESDLIGGVRLDDKDDLLASVLLDLSQSATNEASVDVASHVLSELKRTIRVHKGEVSQAEFAVLKSPDVPSILVEAAFITNPTEEQQLRSAEHQAKLARTLMVGIRDYFALNPPPGTIRIAKQHLIKQGDTLSEIAQRYSVTLASLRKANGVNGDRLKVGQHLSIPLAGDT